MRVFGKHSKIPLKLTLLLAMAVSVSASLWLPMSHASAITASSFNPGHIIDDVVFTNSGSMSVSDIQTFLNAQMPSCDTSGSESISYYYNASNGKVSLSSFSGGTFVTTTRAVYGQRYDAFNGTNIAAAPYVCLNSYIENPTTGQNDLQNPNASFSGGESAAEIIYIAAQDYGINPEVILTTLQKEQGLVTDDWPWLNEYKEAMGFNCPDSGGCSGFAGFFQQVDAAAKQYRHYLTNPNSFNYVVGSDKVPYSPSCAGSTITIQDQSTAALYDYTPYQPDSNVLAHTNPTGSSGGPGAAVSGDSCAAYGNRNFWWYFNTWFGSSTLFNGNLTLSQGLTMSSSTAFAGDTVTASYTVQNSASFGIDAGSLGVCARINGQNFDFGMINDPIIPANGSKVISISKKMTQTGTVSAFICSYNAGGGGWLSNTYPYSTPSASTRTASVNVQANPLATTGLSLVPSSPAIGQSATVTFTLTNSSSTAVDVGSMVVAARDPSGNNVDFPLLNDVTVPANGTYTYSQSRTFSTPGPYKLSFADWNGVWSSDYPASVDGSIVKQLNVTVQDNPLLVTGLSLSATPSVGQPVTATFTLKNASPQAIDVGSMLVAGRDPSGNNVDFPLLNDVTIPANSTYTYSQSRTFTASGNYSFFIGQWNGVWSTNYPKSADSSIVRQLTAKIN